MAGGKELTGNRLSAAKKTENVVQRHSSLPELL